MFTRLYSRVWRQLSKLTKFSRSAFGTEAKMIDNQKNFHVHKATALRARYANLRERIRQIVKENLFSDKN